MGVIVLTREEAKEWVSFVVDDAGAAMDLGENQHAIVREAGDQFKYASVLCGWQCGFEVLFVAVHSYLDCEVDDDEAGDLARDYLTEIGWFSDEPRNPDYIIR